MIFHEFADFVSDLIARIDFINGFVSSTEARKFSQSALHKIWLHAKFTL